MRISRIISFVELESAYYPAGIVAYTCNLMADHFRPATAYSTRIRALDIGILIEMVLDS